MKLALATRELNSRRPFRISRTRRTPIRNVFVRLEQDGICGYGEASPSSFYGETAEIVTEELEHAREFLESLSVTSVADIERVWVELWPLLAPSRAAQCAIDLALWDWLGKSLGRSVCELAWTAPALPIISFGTIGLSSPEELPDKLEELHGFARIKIKSDAAAEVATTAQVRHARPDAFLAIDANCAWNAAALPDLTRRFAEYRVAFIEQPLSPENNIHLTRGGLALPIVADESCVTEDDLDRIIQSFDGFNIKLVKCGGLTPARRMVRRGRTEGARVMVGCMLESSVLIAAGAAIAQQTDYADLDGAWLLANDPCVGWDFRDGVLHPPSEAGLGASAPDDLFPAT